MSTLSPIYKHDEHSIKIPKEGGGMQEQCNKQEDCKVLSQVINNFSLAIWFNTTRY